MSALFSLSSLSFNPVNDVDWDVLFSSPFIFPTTTNESTASITTNQLTFPPSPALSLDNNVPRDHPTPQQKLLPQSKDQYSMALNYPSPSPSLHFESPKTPTRTPLTKSITSIEPTIRRRGPGRPSKAQLAREKRKGKETTKNMATIGRHVHNNSAMRSRARLNIALDELWDEVPEKERLTDLVRELCRAEKMEIVRSYVRKLQKQNRRVSMC